jgi:hypothetical protein
MPEGEPTMSDEQLPIPIPYNIFSVILGYLRGIQELEREIKNEQATQRVMLKALQLQVEDTQQTDNALTTAINSLLATDTTDFSALEAAIQQILAFINTPPLPHPVAAFTLTVTNPQGENMANEKAAKIGNFKVSMNPNGTATATITGVVDAFGNPTTFKAPPTYVCEVTAGAGADPNVTLTPAADGMSCGIAAGTVLVAGDTLTVTGDGVSETYNPVSVVAGPANSFVISVA